MILARLVLVAMGLGACSSAPESTPVHQGHCPAEAPEAGSVCDQEGLRCAYGEDADYLCTAETSWVRRAYRPAPGAGGSPAVMSGGAPLPACTDDDCPEEQCLRTCRGFHQSGVSCVPSCGMKQCDFIAAEHCPTDRCNLIPGCDGELVCQRRFPAIPECGRPGYYAGEVACCEGLSLRCGALIGGVCDASVGYVHSPYCLACGDGTCEAGENECNCPEDCQPIMAP